jgi:hypothetical protein
MILPGSVFTSHLLAASSPLKIPHIQRHADGRKAVLKQPQSRRCTTSEGFQTARSVWTACGSPPLLCASGRLANQTTTLNDI